MRRRLLLALALIFSFTYGYLSHRNRLFPYPLIRRAAELAPRRVMEPDVWSSFRPPAEDQARYQGQKASEMLTVPYLQGYAAADGRRGVTLHQVGRAYPGVNLVLSAHQPEALLLDMDGRPLHRWRYDFQGLGAGFQVTTESKGYDRFWVHASPLPEGGLLAIFSDLALLRLDPRSGLTWAAAGRFHHSATTAPDGSIFALSRRRHRIPRINSDVDVLEDFVVQLDGQGRVLREVSVLDCFERSAYASLLNQVDRWGDLLHTNSISVLDGRLAAKGRPFRQGNWLISAPRLNTVAIIDPGEQRVVWALSGMWSGQHHPTLLENGNVLVFDNRGNNGRSRVVEVEPLTQQVVWDYPGATGRDLFSSCCGAAGRLPNGNTLIIESTNGRAVEVTPDREVVWEFVNPARNQADDTQVATLFSVRRLPAEFVRWVPAPGTGLNVGTQATRPASGGG